MWFELIKVIVIVNYLIEEEIISLKLLIFNPKW